MSKLSLFLIIAIVAGAWAQAPAPDSSPAAPLEPQEIGVVYLLEQPAFTPIEMLRARREHYRGFFGGSQTALVLPGARSPIRFRSQQSLDFVVRVLGALGDPRGAFLKAQDPTQFQLLKLEPDGDKRLLVINDVSYLESSGPEGALLLVRPYGPSSYRLSPGQVLKPGEYAFHYGSLNSTVNQNLYAFGVDGPDSR